MSKCDVAGRLKFNNRMPNNTRTPTIAMSAMTRKTPARVSSGVYLRTILHLQIFIEQGSCSIDRFKNDRREFWQRKLGNAPEFPLHREHLLVMIERTRQKTVAEPAIRSLETHCNFAILVQDSLTFDLNAYILELI